jgi:hypothetical protein
LLVRRQVSEQWTKEQLQTQLLNLLLQEGGTLLDLLLTGQEDKHVSWLFKQRDL